MVDEIALFYKAAKESWGKGIVGFKDDEVFDLAIVMKILPKFHGNRRKLEKPLKEVLKKRVIDGSRLDVDQLNYEDIVQILENWAETLEYSFLYQFVSFYASESYEIC